MTIALVGAGLVRSWPLSLLGLLLLGGILAVTIRDVRNNRIMLHDLRWRVGQTEQRVGGLHSRISQVNSRVNRVSSPTGKLNELKGNLAQLDRELREARALIAICLLDQAKVSGVQLGEWVPPGLVQATVLTLLDRGDPLDAYALLDSTQSHARLSRRTLRKLRNGLWQRGYLPKALEVARLVKDHEAEDRDLLARRRIQGEISVMSGEFTPTVRSEVPEFRSRPGRILHVVGRSLPEDQAGYTLRTHYIAIAQREAGLDPHVVTQMGVSHNDDDYAKEVLDGITYHRIPGPRRGKEPFDLWLRMHVQRLSNLVRVVCPAVLHAASDFVNAQAALAVGKAFGIPAVYESRGFWEETWLSRKAQEYGWDLGRLEATYGLPEAYVWRRQIEDHLRCEADNVVTLDAVMADRIEAGGVPHERITVVPNGVAVDKFPVLGRSQNLAAKLGISGAATVIGYISSLVEYEGVDTLVAAYAEVKQFSQTPLMLLVVGDGPVRNKLVRYAKSLGLGDDAIFTGHVPHDEVLDYYSLIDIFVVPRRPVEVCHLVTPLKPFEAFSTGRTVVLSNVRALAAIADQSGAAELFEAGSSQSLASVLADLLKDPKRREDLAAAGAGWVRAERTWARNARTYRRVYEEAGAISPSAFDTQPETDAISIKQLLQVLPEHKLVALDDRPRSGQVDGRGNRERTSGVRFGSSPFVCGAIGRWDMNVLERMRQAVPAKLESIYASNVAAIWSSSNIGQWQSGFRQGFYWSPLAVGRAPDSWRSAAQDRLAGGVVIDRDTAVLHTCALGIQELYVRELNGALYFAMRIDPLLSLEEGSLHADLSAWASILALGCPVGDATPFVEVRRAAAATAWQVTRTQPDKLTRLSFEPAWLSVDSSAPPPTADAVAELLTALFPRTDSGISVPLSGGRDSRLLAALATKRAGSAPVAWTASTDDGFERDLSLAPLVAEALGLDHHLVVPGPEAWLDDREEVRARLQHQTWYHTWMMPLARVLHERSDAVLDGLGGDVLFDGGTFVDDGLRQQAGGTEKRRALLTRLSKRRLGDTGLIEFAAASWIKEAVESTFMQTTEHLAEHPEMPILSLLATRTTRAIAASSTCLLGPEAKVHLPYVHPEVISIVMQVPFERRAGGAFYHELLESVCGPFVASLPSTKDPGPPGQAVAQRQASNASFAAMAETINSDEQVRALLGPQLLLALDDPELGTGLSNSYNERITLQWADLLATWRRRYSDRLVWPEGGMNG